VTARIGGDGFQHFQRVDSAQVEAAPISYIHIGIVTAVDSGTGTGFVRIPALNEDAQLGPYKFLQPFTNQITTPVKQTLSTTSATVSGTSVLTSVSLSATTTSISGVIGSLNLPAVGQRVLVVMLNDSLDQGVIVGKL
jgi:hypothetical protein